MSSKIPIWLFYSRSNGLTLLKTKKLDEKVPIIEEENNFINNEFNLKKRNNEINLAPQKREIISSRPKYEQQRSNTPNIQVRRPLISNNQPVYNIRQIGNINNNPGLVKQNRYH
jgi:hypothetical protein